jgi:DNA-binding transcriptional MocR family regulator
VIAAALKHEPEKSDRQHAAALGVSNKTVSEARKELESTGDVCKSHTSTDTLGRKQPRKKSKPVAEPIPSGFSSFLAAADRQIGRGSKTVDYRFSDPNYRYTLQISEIQ